MQLRTPKAFAHHGGQAERANSRAGTLAVMKSSKWKLESRKDKRKLALASTAPRVSFTLGG
jgi:hypothetical protein